MASDEIVWQIINQQFCSFKIKTRNSNFCRNEYNVTGFCDRLSCPLANSRYATVRQDPHTGVLYLYMKTVERSHLPSKWWERIRLSSNYARALEQIDERLIYWPKFLVHKCKQRLTRLTQVAIRTKRLIKEQQRLGETLVPKLAPKIKRREETRERKALAAAQVERAIERELLNRLKSGAYNSGDTNTQPMNVDEKIWKKLLRSLEKTGQGERDLDLDDADEEEELEYEKEGVEGEVEYVSDIEGESDEDLDDLEDWVDSSDDDLSNPDSEAEDDEEGDDDESSDHGSVEPKPGQKRKRPVLKKPTKSDKKRSKGPKLEIEYETEPAPKQLVEA